MKQRIFISSAQKEFAEERQALKDYLLGDALLSRFFDVFLFEDLPASEFTLTDGFVTTIRRKPELAFKAVGGQVEALSRHQAGTKLALSGNQVEILRQCRKDSAITELMELIGRSDRTKFRNQVLKPLLKDGLLDLTVPNKPTSSLQKYRLNEKGKALLDALIPKGDRA